MTNRIPTWEMLMMSGAEDHPVIETEPVIVESYEDMKARLGGKTVTGMVENKKFASVEERLMTLEAQMAVLRTQLIKVISEQMNVEPAVSVAPAAPTKKARKTKEYTPEMRAATRARLLAGQIAAREKRAAAAKAAEVLVAGFEPVKAATPKTKSKTTKSKPVEGKYSLIPVEVK